MQIFCLSDSRIAGHELSSGIFIFIPYFNKFLFLSLESTIPHGNDLCNKLAK